MIASVLFLLASVFYFVAGLGLFRLPDSLARLHAGTKASSLATLLALAAAVSHHGTLHSVLICGASLLFVFLTSPLGSHAIARCLLHSSLHDPDGLANAGKVSHDADPDPRTIDPSAQTTRPKW